MKKLLSVILAVAMLASLCTVSAFAADVTFSFNASLDETGIVTVEVRNSADIPYLSAMEIGMTYDSSVLEPVTTKPSGCTLGTDIACDDFNAAIPGEISINLCDPALMGIPVAANSKIISFQLKVKDGVSVTKDLVFGWKKGFYADENLDTIYPTLVNGLISAPAVDDPTKIETTEQNFASDVVATDTVIGGKTIPAGSKTLLSYSKKAAVTGKTWVESGAVLSLSGAADVTIETADCVGPALHFVGDAYGIIFTGTAIKAGSTYVVRTYTKFSDGTVLYSDAKSFVE